MAIIITQEKKKQRRLILIFMLVILMTFFVFWFGFLRGEEAGPSPLEEFPVGPAIVYALPRVDIDWQMLDSLREETLRPFEGIGAFTGSFGRDNPFIPY